MNTNYTVYKPQCNKAVRVRQTFFIEHVIDVWNSPPTSVDFSSLATFKSSIRSVNFSSFMRYSFNKRWRCHCWLHYSLLSVCLFINFIDTSIYSVCQ